MDCQENLVFYLSWFFIVGGAAFFLKQMMKHTLYGRYTPASRRTCPARLGWFLQELPSFLLPLLLFINQITDPAQRHRPQLGSTILLCMYMLHYFHRTFIYAFLTRGRRVPVVIVLGGAIFCSLSGFLQGHHLLHCARLEDGRLKNVRLTAGILLFFVGMTINIHSDHILRHLRKPGEIVYRIPHGGMFELVSGANYFGEIVEWCGYAVATWSLPTFSFAFFTICSIGPRAYHHHRDYQGRFEDYPRSRKAIIPFVL